MLQNFLIVYYDSHLQKTSLLCSLEDVFAINVWYRFHSMFSDVVQAFSFTHLFTHQEIIKGPTPFTRWANNLASSLWTHHVHVTDVRSVIRYIAQMMHQNLNGSCKSGHNPIAIFANGATLRRPPFSGVGLDWAPPTSPNVWFPLLPNTTISAHYLLISLQFCFLLSFFFLLYSLLTFVSALSTPQFSDELSCFFFFFFPTPL